MGGGMRGQGPAAWNNVAFGELWVIQLVRSWVVNGSDHVLSAVHREHWK